MECKRAEKARRYKVFSMKQEKGARKEKLKKIKKKFKKGIAQFQVFEYNVGDVCKGDEATDCSLACEVTVADHVR